MRELRTHSIRSASDGGDCVWGKESLTDAAWHSRCFLRPLRARFARLPFEAKLLRHVMNAADRSFKVLVKMP